MQKITIYKHRKLQLPYSYVAEFAPSLKIDHNFVEYDSLEKLAVMCVAGDYIAESFFVSSISEPCEKNGSLAVPCTGSEIRKFDELYKNRLESSRFNI